MALDMKPTCRGCLEDNESLFHSLKLKYVRDLFTSCTGITIEEESCLPSQLCSLCFEKCEKWDEFRRLCYKIDYKLKKRFGLSDIDRDTSSGGERPNTCWIKQSQDANFAFPMEDLITTGSSMKYSSEEEENDGSYTPGIEDTEEMSQEEGEDAEAHDIKLEENCTATTKNNSSEDSLTNGCYTCEECRRTYKFVTSYNNHMAKHAAGLIRKKRVKEEPPVSNVKHEKSTATRRPKPIFICEECGAIHQNLLALKKHKFAHELGIKPHVRNSEKLLERAKDPDQLLLAKSWTIKSRKSLKRAGLPYISNTGELVVKELKSGCASTCRRNCHGQWSQEDRQRVFDHYNQLGGFEAQKKFLMDNVDFKKVDRSCVSGRSRRTFTLLYRLEGKQVCKKFFIDTVGVSDNLVSRCVVRKRVVGLQEWHDGRGSKRGDGRGRKSKIKT